MAYLSTVASSALGYQNFFSGKLTSSLTASDTDIPMDTIPSVSEGVLVIDWDVAASREVIFFNSKTASKVVCPSAANGRGFDGSTATTHASGANVIMAPVADYFRYIQSIATTSTAAWKALGYVPDSITDNGNRSYTMVFNSVDLTSFISRGMRLKGTPTTAQPTQCADLESGSSQYFNKTSPAGMTFTDDFVVGAWVKIESYAAMSIASRFNGTSGWRFILNSSGQLTLQGFKAGGSNLSYVISYQSVPLNKWVHVAAQLDMSAFTATTTTSYIMIDGVDVPASVARGGTNPTDLTQAGNLEIGSNNAAEFFDGKIAQVFVSSAKITQANVRVIKNQGLTAALCTTHSIVSAYSLSNTLNDINTGNANNLTAQGSAAATNADSPFGLNDAGTPGTSEWGIVTSASFSTNTTLVVQAPEGSAWPTSPTSSAISAMSYSTEKQPYGFPGQRGKWEMRVLNKTASSQSTPGTTTWYNLGSLKINVPIGSWRIAYSVSLAGNRNAANSTGTYNSSLSTSSSAETDTEMTARSRMDATSASANNLSSQHSKERYIDTTSATDYFYIARVDASNTDVTLGGDTAPSIIAIELAHL